MDQWDEIPAPQWNDFQSPMCNESYFSMVQDDTIQELESSYMSETITEKSPLREKPLSTNFIDEIDKVKMTPIHIISPNKKNKENVVTETTYEDFLAKRVREIHLDSARKSARKSMKNTPNKDRVSNDQYFTPSDRLLSPEDLKKQLSKSLRTKLNFLEVDQVPDLNLETKNLEEEMKEDKKEEKKDEEVKEVEVAQKEEKEETEEVKKEDNVLKPKLITDRFTLKNPSKVPTVAKVKTQKVLPYQNRRLSMKMVKKPETKVPPKPFVSTAEAVAKFQAGTPKRFRSVGAKPEKPSVLSKFTAKQLTQAVSPALISKNRVRRTAILSQAERDEIEMEKFRANPIKANPIKNLKKPENLKKVEKKPSTIPEPFKLTEVRKTQVALQPPQPQTSKVPTLKKAVSQELLKKPTTQTTTAKRTSVASGLKRPTSVDFGKLKKSNSMTLCDVVKMPEFRKPIQEISVKKAVSGEITRVTRSLAPANSTAVKNTVPVVVKSDGQAITVQEKEVTHFGIKIAQQKHLKHKAVPFSFDKRTKEFQEKKQQKLKQLQEEQLQKQKTDFHAEPVPVFKRSNSTPQLSSKTVSVTKTQTTPQPFSFEQRDKLFLEKKQENQKQAQEVDAKARLFHANPVPNFKPVAVSTQFKINSKKQPVINKNQPLKALPAVKREERKSPKKSPIKKDPNKFKRSVPKFELHSDKRARERKEFDEKCKQKLMEEEEMKKKVLEDKNEKEKEMESVLRKQMQMKARPMPDFKPLPAISSAKQLTSPHSPAWAMKNKVTKDEK